MQQLLDAKPGGSEFSSSILDSPSKLKTRGVNFTMFLTMMGEHLLELDPEADMLEAFACFDENDEGKVKVEEMRKWLSEVGDRMDSQEVRFCSNYHTTALCYEYAFRMTDITRSV